MECLHYLFTVMYDMSHVNWPLTGPKIIKVNSNGFDPTRILLLKE